MPQPPTIFVDFDGTISRDDTTDAILEQLADPRWLEVEAAWQRGEMGSADCMAKQIELLRATPDMLHGVIEHIEIDPGFIDFLQFCESRTLPVAVLSDGLDMVAEVVLRRSGVGLPIFSNHLVWQGEDKWKLTFPHARPDCLNRAGNCKCAPLSSPRQRGGLSVLIGDGRSDFCGAAEADVVFAKGKLVGHCERKRLAHISFENFTDLLPVFEAWWTGALDAAGLPTHLPLPMSR